MPHISRHFPLRSKISEKIYINFLVFNHSNQILYQIIPGSQPGGQLTGTSITFCKPNDT